MDRGALDRKPLLINDPDSNTIVHPACGVHSLQGVRTTMEDRHVTLPHPLFNEECKIPAEVPRSLFAVFDGHGGHVCAEYTKRNLHKNFVIDPAFFDDPAKALFNAVMTTDQKFAKAAHDLKLKSSSGTCAIIAYIERNSLFVANVGDSRAVLCSAGKAIDLSSDHKPDRPDERRRVEQYGGKVARAENEGALQQCLATGMQHLCACAHVPPMRVYPGGLAISRSLGDVGIKGTQTVIADPEIKQHNIRLEKDEFLILACDGVWDVLSSQAAVDIVRKTLQEQRNPTAASVSLAKTALERGSTDNISVIVITFSDYTHNG